MQTVNILLAGIGGQGLVMTTQLICQAAFLEGYQLKSNDVIGLAQRGGKVWGSVRFGAAVHSPNILPGQADFLVGIEPLEALRWKPMLKKDGFLFLNNRPVIPTRVQQEMEPYPEETIDSLIRSFSGLTVDAEEKARKLGNEKAANTLLVGAMAATLPLTEESWLQAIRDTYPEKLQEVNEKAWHRGRELMNTRGQSL